MPVAKQIRELRQRLARSGRPCSQSRLAAQLGVSTTTVAAWEQGLYEPEAINFLRLAQLCDGTLSEFFARRAGLAPGEAGYAARAARAGAKRPARWSRAAPGEADRLATIEALLRELLATLRRLEARLAPAAAPGPAAAAASGVTVREPIAIPAQEQKEDAKKRAKER